MLTNLSKRYGFNNAAAMIISADKTPHARQNNSVIFLLANDNNAINRRQQPNTITNIFNKTPISIFSTPDICQILLETDMPPSSFSKYFLRKMYEFQNYAPTIEVLYKQL